MTNETAISTDKLSAYLTQDRLKSIYCYESVVSTNTFMKEQAARGLSGGSVIIANEQTGGRGRMGRSFVSLKDKGIYMSVLLRPDMLLPIDTMSLTGCTSVSVSRAIDTVCSTNTCIKWVNDILLNRKKICGILTEMSVSGENGHIDYIVIGIGVNIGHAQSDFPEELKDTASSLFAETGIRFSRVQLCAEIIKQIDRLFTSWPGDPGIYLPEYIRRCITLNNEITVTYEGSIKYGTAIAVNEDFSLSVRFKDGSVHAISCQDAHVRGLYGYT